ncbi:hypothetical protein R3P38DRAFT_2834347 [Favolaschia claudopus]|uniref:Uncharacterized protein n=1 Tax=Favolaschia claudopus TaxID=2862362 RepID=A0AAW0EF88_9AGAR
MPPRTQPKIYQLLIKSHKLTILLTIQPTTSVSALKSQVLAALASNLEPDVPVPSSISDFELCKGVRKDRGKLTGEFVLLEDTKQSVRDAGVANWEALFLRFRDAESGDLLPVEFTPFEDDEEGVTAQFESTPAPASGSAAVEPSSSTSRGKRKAHPD